LIKFVLGKEACWIVLNEIKSTKRGFKIPKPKIVKPPEERENRPTALNNIAVFDSPPFGKSLVEEALLGGLYEADDNKLYYSQNDDGSA